MRSWRSVSPCWFSSLALVCALAAFRPAFAQQAQPPTLDEILQRLESNLQHYRATIPSFFCDERVVSKVNQYPSQGPQLDTAVNSVFRLKRDLDADGTTILTESRDIRTINGHPAMGSDISGPSILEGAFSGGLSVVSLSQQACMHYTLRPIKPGPARGNYIVEFASVPIGERPAGCFLDDDGSGRVFIDPAALQITRMEIKAPHHGIFPKTAGGQSMPALLGSWAVSVVYAPVVLEGQTLWMPANISSSTMTKSVDWTFKASYRNCHRLEVTSHILPAGASPTH